MKSDEGEENEGNGRIKVHLSLSFTGSERMKVVVLVDDHGDDDENVLYMI